MTSLLGLVFLAVSASVAVFGLGWVLSSEGAERAAAAGSLLLALMWLATQWPVLRRRWVAPVSFVLGCFLGLNLLFHGLAQRDGALRHEMAMEAVVFEQSALPLLKSGQCVAAMAFLRADLDASSFRSAPSLVVRADVWKEAVAGGCVTRSEWADIRQRLRELAQTAPMGIQGVPRTLILDRIGG